MRSAPRSPARGAGKLRGFTLVSAIFLLVVLAALGAAILVVSTTQQIGSALDVQGARAYQAARAGVEWGAYKWLRSSSCGALTSFTFPSAPTLAGITVTVTCTAYPDGNGGPTVYEIQSTACNQPSGGNCPNALPGSNYIERRLKVTL
ncbi:MAG: hypothetical protein A3I01_01835 [Betaproteobacteria bacterium RIFCSPLOWO2_02_FULL_65_24]|nr:MAG: hypothetical protein A3I01_01835 [Betaproteobacteria bacterium RIFCSPLOWO2_02_FULL_65_24]